MTNVSGAKYLADLDYFKSLLDKEPDSTYYIPVAALFIALEKYDEVISVCKQGLERFPNFLQLEVLYAEGLIRTGRHEEALNILFDVIMRDEDNYYAIKLVGALYKEKRYKKEAVKYLRAAYLKAPEDMETYEWLEELGVADSIYDPTQAVVEEEEFAGEEDDVLFDISKELKAAGEALQDLKADMAQQGAVDKDDEEDILDLGGEELSDDDIMKALAESPLDDDLFDDGEVYDLSQRPVKIMTGDEIQPETIVLKGGDLPFVVYDDDDDDDDDSGYDTQGDAAKEHAGVVLPGEDELGIDGSDGRRSAGSVADGTDRSQDTDFIPKDLVDSVFSEAGIDSFEDIFNEEDRITPESIKGGKNAE